MVMRFCVTWLSALAVATLVRADCISTLSVPSVAVGEAYWFQCVIPPETVVAIARFTLSNPSRDTWAVSVETGADCLLGTTIVSSGITRDETIEESTQGWMEWYITNERVCIVLKNKGNAATAPTMLVATVYTRAAVPIVLQTQYNIQMYGLSTVPVILHVPQQVAQANQIAVTTPSADYRISVTRQIEACGFGPFQSDVRFRGTGELRVSADLSSTMVSAYYICIHAATTTLQVSLSVATVDGWGTARPITSSTSMGSTDISPPLSFTTGRGPFPVDNSAKIAGIAVGAVLGGLAIIATVAAGVFFHIRAKKTTHPAASSTSFASRQQSSIEITHTNPLQTARVATALESAATAPPASAAGSSRILTGSLRRISSYNAFNRAGHAVQLARGAPAGGYYVPTPAPIMMTNVAMPTATTIAPAMPTTTTIAPAMPTTTTIARALPVAKTPVPSIPIRDVAIGNHAAAVMPDKPVLNIDLEYTSIDNKCFIIPWSEQKVAFGETEIETHYQRSPFNITCCAARMHETTHWDRIRLIEHTRGARLCSTLLMRVVICAIVSVLVYFVHPSRLLYIKILTSIGVFIGLVLCNLIMWVLHRKAWFTFQGDFAETSPMKAAFSEKGMRVSQWRIDDTVRAAWAAWAHFRGFSPFDPLQAERVPTNTLATDLIERKCFIPWGSSQLNIIDERAAVIKSTAGCFDLDCCTQASWKGFWTDDVKWVRYKRGNSAWGNVLAAAVAAAAGGGIIALSVALSKASASTVQTASISFATVSWGLYVIRWLLSGKTYLQFGISKSAAPIVRVPRASSWDDYAKAASSVLRCPVDLSSSVAPFEQFSGTNAYGDHVKLTVTPDVTEIHTYRSRLFLCSAYCCSFSSAEEVYRVPTASIRFVHSSIQSLVDVVIKAFIIVALFTVPSFIAFKLGYLKDSMMGAFIVFGAIVAIVKIVVGGCCRRAAVVLGTPLSRHMTTLERITDALGLLSEEKKYMFHVEFLALSSSPEDTVRKITEILRGLLPTHRRVAGPVSTAPTASAGAPTQDLPPSNGQSIASLHPPTITQGPCTIQPANAAQQGAGVGPLSPTAQPVGAVKMFTHSTIPEPREHPSTRSSPLILEKINQQERDQSMSARQPRGHRTFKGSLAKKSFSDDPAPIGNALRGVASDASHAAALATADQPGQAQKPSARANGCPPAVVEDATLLSTPRT